MPHIFNIVCHNFQCDIVQNSSKLGFVTMFLEVYKYFFCSKLPIEEVCFELNLAFALEGSHWTC